VPEKSVWINMVPACMEWREPAWHQVVVRENLYWALWNLSRRKDRPGERKSVWVDAICINQEDDKEKGEQVQGMGELYAQATTVVVWLGTAADSSDVAFDFLHAVLRPSNKEWLIQEATPSDAG
jgi:hypothetical protein